MQTIDNERIVPDEVMTLKGRQPVTGIVAYLPGPGRVGCPIVSEMMAVEVRTPAGSRWYGCARAWIGADLRMHVTGISPGFTEMMNWPKPTREGV